jgi:hypothetical protein
MPMAGLPSLPEGQPLAGQVLDRTGPVPAQAERHGGSSLERQVLERQALDRQASEEHGPERRVPERRSPGRWVPDRRDPTSRSDATELRPAGRGWVPGGEDYPFGRANADRP